MGLFINNSEHPDVFMNQDILPESNQGYFRFDYFTEMLKEQKKINDSLTNSFQHLKMQYYQQKNNDLEHWEAVGVKLRDLKESNLLHEEFESHAREWLAMLDSNNRELQEILVNEGLLKHEIIDEINAVSKSNQAIVNQLEKYESSNQQLTLQMNELFQLHSQLSDQISKQGEDQTQVFDRMENQEAMLEKTLRQINNIRSILFERTNYLAEKMENSYNLTSSFIYKLMTGSDQPLTFFMMNQKKLEDRKTLD